jgi:heme exporter protein D
MKHGPLPNYALIHRPEMFLTMFDLEREQIRKTYQLCRLAFIMLGTALALACFTSLLGLFGRFQPGLLHWIQGSVVYEWVDAPIVWGCLIGATLLWGRWDHVSWQRRAGLFLVMNLVDLGLWFIARADALAAQGADFGHEFGHEWLRDSLGTALGWGEFALISSLTCDYLVHLGVEHARESDKSTRSMAATGAMVWLLYFCQRTNWRAGWPLQVHQLRALDGFLVFYGYHLIWTITLIQVTALVVSAVRQSTTVLEEIDREDQENDLLRSRSDSSRPFEEVGSHRDEGRRPF